MSAMEVDAPAQPYTFDLGHLLCEDTNPLPAVSDPRARETQLAARAQQCAQALLHQLLTTCPITRAADDGNLQLTLPAPHTALPREKPVPQAREKTKWERFAEKKGIKAKKRDGKLVFDEATGEWAPKYGYKGKKAAGGVEADWLVEVEDEKKTAAKEDARRPKGEGDIARRDRKTRMRSGK